MGILNVTPDSFSDGGRFLALEAGLEWALAMLDEGADILDLGGESTRPNAVPVSEEEEQGRVLPALRAILKARPEAVVSIDTYHASTARLAVGMGAEIVNDVSGHLWDAEMAGVCAELGCGVVLMHTRGRPQEWGAQARLRQDEVVPLVVRELRERVEAAMGGGIARERIVVDPGFGFGKRGEENLALLAGLGELKGLGLPVLAGLSRKSFLRTAGSGDIEAATAAANAAAVLAGAHVLRVHDVGLAREAAAVGDRLLGASRS
jgi:dihydropteroate synthase